MNDIKSPIIIDNHRCPANLCNCGHGGGAFLCQTYHQPQHKGAVIRVACPRSKKLIIEIVIGGGDE